MDQIIIAITGTIAVWLSQSKDQEKVKYACIFGLIGQPFWIYTTLQAEQYGLFLLSIIYTFAWFRGIRNYWLNG